ncbi:MAG TPA: hypothetical protein VMV59_10170 [Candidatus Dormibacteraeota bacterium]|nr:hypothetical protein [Candidatus Dormibacteraeota bacterium]
MIENNGIGDGLPDTLADSLIGSLESRAAARAALDAPRSPNIIITFFGEDPKTASIGNRTFTRGAGETAEQFEKRLLDECPASGVPAAVIMWGGN